MAEQVQPQYKPRQSGEFYWFDSSEKPSKGEYDPDFGLKEGKGLNGFASLLIWRSPDKFTMHVKFNLGPYDWAIKGVSGIKHKGGSGTTARHIWEGVSIYDTWYTGENGQEKYWGNADKPYVHLTAKNNGKKLSFKVKYRIGTACYMARRDAPLFWFGNFRNNPIKYRKGYFSEPQPKPFDEASSRCEPLDISGRVTSWKSCEATGWCEPVFDSKTKNKRIIARGTDVKKTWGYYNWKYNKDSKTEWNEKYGYERRANDNDGMWESDTGHEQQRPNATRKHTYWVYEATYSDYIISGGILVLPKPPAAPEIEVIPADGVKGDIIVKYKNPAEPKEPVYITTYGYSRNGDIKALITDRRRYYNGEEAKRTVTFKDPRGKGDYSQPSFAEGYDIRYCAVAVDNYGQKAGSDSWSSGKPGHHYNKAPETPTGWKDNPVVPTETKPYTKINVTHSPAYDIEGNNVTYDMEYEFFNKDGSVAVSKRQINNNPNPDFGELNIGGVSDGGLLKFWSTPKDGFEHDNYSGAGYHEYRKGYAALRPENVWPAEKSIVRNKRPRIVIKNAIRDGESAPEKEQVISVRWMDTWYNNKDHRQYFSSGNTNISNYIIFKPPIDCFSVDGKVSVSVKAHNGSTESKTLDRIFFYKEFEYEKIIPLKSAHVNLLKVAIDDERAAYDLPKFEYNRDHGPNTEDILVLKDEILFNEDYNSLRESILEVNTHINSLDDSSDTDYTNYKIPEIGNLDLVDPEFAEWQKLLTVINNI